ncbi:hypothetical protein SAMN05444392_11928 [Seinonella peptonophila]|uniref:Uncharacterized protein n=1 Tax=Seinonella peptonophila TaxID=112248 RepID=A0A1M5B844_9BACL|nr:hypothetical protein SAMN05444392_11928 [Seinonella peptonophila]
MYASPFVILILTIFIAIFIIWIRVKDKSKSSSILTILSSVLTLVYVGYAIKLLIVAEPQYYGVIAFLSLLCGPVLIVVGLVAFLRDRKNFWARISFTFSICATIFGFLFGMIYDSQ